MDISFLSLSVTMMELVVSELKFQFYIMASQVVMINKCNKIEDKRNIALALAGEGQEIDQVEVFQKSLGSRRGHTRG
ncbi:hypothetical protein QVD17_42074 [Tagetes erecta]|uniref:Uncharacterized protein n=1 Tax=Tagetes erecta TaxID=13708 RepID=A0AAD8JLD7_TARER|nr:hypothetical protein QVD17_42074 [Tagetes erecta]